MTFDHRHHQLLAQLIDFDARCSQTQRHYMGAAEFEHGAYPKALAVLAKHGKTGETPVPRGSRFPSGPWSRLNQCTDRDLVVRWIAPNKMPDWRNELTLNVREWMPSIISAIMEGSLGSRERMMLEYMFGPRTPSSINVVGWVNLSNDWHGRADTGLIHAAFVCDPADPHDPGDRAWESFRTDLAQRSVA